MFMLRLSVRTTSHALIWCMQTIPLDITLRQASELTISAGCRFPWVWQAWQELQCSSRSHISSVRC